MKASEIMTPSPRVCTPQTTAREVARLMRDADTGVIPVVENEESKKLVGLVTDRDLALRLLGEGRDGSAPVAEAMSRDVTGVRPDADVTEVKRLMADRQVRRVPVCDSQGRCLGIISQADLALEEGIGDQAVGKVVEAVSEPSPRRH